MTAPRWPDVCSALLTLLPALPGMNGVQVYDGQPITEDAPTDYVTVGYVFDDSAGSFIQARDPDGFGLQESGEVKCHFVSRSGESLPPETRNRAFAMVGALQSELMSDQSLRGALPDGSTVELSSEVMSVQNGQGSAQSLLVTVRYYAVSYLP